MNANSIVLKCTDLQKKYGSVEVVKSLTINVHQEQVCVLVGPNGCGKTSAIETMLGLRRKDGGSVCILGASIPDQLNLVRGRLRVTLQNGSLHSHVTVLEQLEYLGALYHVIAPCVKKAAEELGISHLYSRKFGTLSGGEQRRVMVAEALIGSPEFICLDEPTSGVDMESRSLLWNSLRNTVRHNGTGVLMTTHDLNEAEEYGDYIFVMRFGRLISEGCVSDIIKQSGIERVVVIKTALDTLTECVSKWGCLVLSKTENRSTIGASSLEKAEGIRVCLSADQPKGCVSVRKPRLSDAYAALCLAFQEESS